MKTLYTIDNISFCSDGESEDNGTIICHACGKVFEQSKNGNTLRPFIFSFGVSMFVLRHHKCKRKKDIKVGDDVTDLMGNYLGKVNKINRKKKTALVKDSYDYKETHRLSELLPK